MQDQETLDTSPTRLEWETAACIFCGPHAAKHELFRSPDRLTDLPGIFSVVRCEGCGLVFQDPRPTEASIHFAYPDSYHVYQASAVERSSWRQRLDGAVLANYFGYRHLAPTSRLLKAALYPLYWYAFKFRSIPKFKADGRLLEIGCAFGGRIARDRSRGWTVTGVDFNARAISWGREHLGLDLRCGSIFEMDFADDSFDVIVLDMVLEHLHHPIEVLERIRKWLKPGGELLFSIPYFEGLEFGVFKQYAYGLQLPAHLYFFNRDHVQRLLAGFDAIDCVSTPADKDMTEPLAYMANDGRNRLLARVARNRLAKLAVFRPLSYVLAASKRSSRLLVRATRRS
jgi:SAM-dependent methyltransferase